MSTTFSPEFARKNQHHAQTLHTIETAKRKINIMRKL